MHPYIHQMTVPRTLEERRRQAPPRRTPRRRAARASAGAGTGLVALGAALSAAGRRLQARTPAGDPGCAAC